MSGNTIKTFQQVSKYPDRHFVRSHRTIIIDTSTNRRDKIDKITSSYLPRKQADSNNRNYPQSFVLGWSLP